MSRFQRAGGGGRCSGVCVCVCVWGTGGGRPRSDAHCQCTEADDVHETLVRGEVSSGAGRSDGHDMDIRGSDGRDQMLSSTVFVKRWP